VEWIDSEERWPDVDEIVAFNQHTGEVFNLTFIESKWGNNFRDEKFELQDWTHWRPRVKE